MIINVIEALDSGFEVPPLRLDNGLAKAAPKSALTVAPDSAIIQSAVNFGRIGYSMVFGYMGLELLATMTGFATIFGWINSARLFTHPQIKLAMLAVLMTLPVILAAESLCALWKSAAVWLLVSLFMFPLLRLAREGNGIGTLNLLELTRPRKDFATIRLVADHLTKVTYDIGK